MGTRRKGREFALQSIYLGDITEMDPTKILSRLTYGQSIDEKSLAFAQKLTAGILEHQTNLDEMIVKYTKNWEMGRMAALDRNILRLGAYEILYELDTPISVVIDEAVEIAKIYSTADSGKFVNGILDKLKNERKDKVTPEPRG